MTTTTATSIASLVLPPLSSKTLSLYTLKSTSISLSFSSSPKPISISASFPSSSSDASSPSFVQHASVSQDQEVLSDVGEPNVSMERQVYVGNLPFTVDEAQLAQLFDGAFHVQKVEVMYDELTGRSRGFGFVTMSSAQEVEAAVRQCNGYELDGRPLRVYYRLPPPPLRSEDSSFRGATGDPPRGRGYRDSSNRLFDEEVFSNNGEPNFWPEQQLFIGNLPYTVDNAQLAGLFEDAFDVQMAEVICHKKTGKSFGFGFVTMSSAEEAEAAALQFNGYELDGRVLTINHRRPPPPPRSGDFFFRGTRGSPSRGGSYGDCSNRSGPSRGGGYGDSSNRLFVSNLACGVDNLALANLFNKQGEVLEAYVVYDRTNRSRGFGFVTYRSADEMNSAIESLDGVDLNGGSIRVTVAKPRLASSETF